MEIEFPKAQISTHSHDEEERREDNVSQCHSIPFRMLQGCVDMVTRSIVDKDHQHHCQSTEQIDANEAFRSIHLYRLFL
jgi:hypothetical protein